jgi:hypothetical protein
MLLLPHERVLTTRAVQLDRRATRRSLVHLDGHLGSYWRWVRAERSLRDVVNAGPGLKASRLQQLEQQPLPNPTLRTLLAMQTAFGFSSVEELLGPSASQSWAELYFESGEDDT